MATAIRNQQDGGEAILEAFRNLGVEYVMSSPGSEWGPVWEALARQQVGGAEGPTYLSCWHETLAVNLAIGHSAVTGKLQIVMLHAGAGLLQGAMGVHAAQLTETPMVVLSGEALTYGENKDFDPGRQWFTSLSIVGGPQRLLEPMVKWGNQASSPETLYEQIVRAGEIAQRTPAGPTYVSVPIENMLAEWTPPAKLRKVPPPPRLRPSAADVERVAGMIAAAKNPVISVESAGRDPAAYAALVRLAEEAAIPVVEGIVANFTNFPKDHALHLGYGMQPALQEADLVLVVSNRVPWYPPNAVPPNAKIVVIDDNPHKAHMVYQNIQGDAYLEGNVAASLSLLAEAVAAAGLDKDAVTDRFARCRAAHDALQADIAAELEKVGGGTPMDPAVLCAGLTEAMPDNAVFVDETTTHRRCIQRHLNWGGAQSYYGVPSGLGQGLGVGLGVKLANPDRPVVSIIGDGAFLYNPVVQSLGFARDANLPMLIVVFNNGGYKAMKNNQLSYYPDGAGKQNNLYLGHTINGPDYAELAQPFGGFGRRVDSADDLAPALKEGLDAVENGRTAIINAVIAGS